MASINDRLTVDKLIANKGKYEDDSQVVRIVQYNNVFDGGLTYGLEYEGELGRYHASPFIQNPKVLWSLK